jgi:hypothetical protein
VGKDVSLKESRRSARGGSWSPLPFWWSHGMIHGRSDKGRFVSFRIVIEVSDEDSP